MKFQLKPKQIEFIFATEQFPAFIASIGTTKTTCMIERAMVLSSVPNNLGVIIRKNFVDLRDSTMRDFELYTGLTISKDTKEVQLQNGSIIMFRHGDELPVLKNLNLGWFGMEQAEEFGDSISWDMLTMRLRRQVPFRTGFLIANANGHNWIWNKWIKNKLDNHRTIEATTYDFADILPKDYISNMEKNLPAKLFKRYVLNSHDEAQGLVYDEFESSKHLIKPFDIPDTWEKGFVLDHGFRNPTAILWYAIDHDGVIYLWAEHYEREKPISYHATAIKYHNILDGYADPSIFAKNQSRAGSSDIYSIADEYSDCGIRLIPATREEEKARISRVNEFFKADRIKAFDTLQNFEKEITSWKWKEIRPSLANLNLPEVPEDSGNHLMDDLGYLIASRFGATPKPEIKFEKKSLDWYDRYARMEKEHKEAQRPIW